MRIHSLQGVRAICILLVLLAHVAGTRNFPASRVLEAYGNPGVRIFLILSGYLISSQLIKEREKTGGISLRRFYARRAYRIFPAAYVFMAIVIAVNWVTLSRANILTALTYTLNYYPRGNHVLGHLWSLGVEEQFYLVWPLCLLLFFRQRVWIVGAVVVGGPFLRMLFWLLWRRAGLEHPFPVFMDALATGAAVSMLEPRLKQFQALFLSRTFLVVPAITLLIPLTQFWSNRIYESLGFTVFQLGVGLSLVHVMQRRYWILNSAPFVWVGSISYSLYLWQQPFLNRWSSAPWAAFPLNLALAVLFAAASYYFVEEPFLNLRERRSPKCLPYLNAARLLLPRNRRRIAHRLRPPSAIRPAEHPTSTPTADSLHRSKCSAPADTLPAPAQILPPVRRRGRVQSKPAR
jgi:peptidoglycan/LPS O-acetylase OafA/YrhL